MWVAAGGGVYWLVVDRGWVGCNEGDYSSAVVMEGQGDFLLSPKDRRACDCRSADGKEGGR